MKLWQSLALALATVLPAAPLNAAAAGAAPDDYRFAAGDVIEITVTPQKNFDRMVTVQPDGKISYPLVGQVQAAGLTVEQLARQLHESLGQELNDPQVTVSLHDLNKQSIPRVSLLGAVRTPGVFEIKPGTTVAEVLASGGGPTPAADLQRVTITRVDRTLQVVDLSQTDKTGHLELNPGLEQGDVIVIPESARASVLVVGEVAKPGSYEIQRDARLMDAISKAGGLTDKADLRRVTLSRAGASGPQILDLQPLLGKSDTADPSLNVLLQPGDTITVPETVEQVYVLGRVVRPNTYQFKPQDRVLDAIVMAGGAEANGDLSKTVLLRRDANGSAVAKQIDIKSMMAKGNMANNEPLRPGDVIVVADKKVHRPVGTLASTLIPFVTLATLLHF